MSFGWWVMSYHSLTIQTGPNIPLMDVGDQMRWKLKPNGDFDIRSFYIKLRDSPSVVFPWKGIWRVKVPQRVSFFVWSVVCNKMLTGDDLRLRGIDFVDWCIMCHRCGETMDHLLLHCKAYRLWSFVFTTFVFLRVIPRWILDLLFGWWNWLEKHLSHIWNLVPLCLLWSLEGAESANFWGFGQFWRSDACFFYGTLFD